MRCPVVCALNPIINYVNVHFDFILQMTPLRAEIPSGSLTPQEVSLLDAPT